MRIGLLADVHANLDALRAVLADGADRVTHWWFLGDAVGRGPAPIETLHLLRQQVHTRHWLVGNHDLYVTGLLPAGNARNADRYTWHDHRRRLKAYRPDGRRPRLWEWCRRTWQLERARPRLIRAKGADCWLVHAALGDSRFNVGDVPTYSYGFPWQDVGQRVIRRQQFEQLDALRQRPGRTVILIHGHTHLPYLAVQLWGWDDDMLFPIRYGEPQRLDQFRAVLINPGSVGLPRNCDALVHAAYGILDTEASTFEFRRVRYDSEPTRLAMASLGYDISLIRQLEPNDEGNHFRQTDAVCLEWQRTYRPTPWGWEPIVEMKT
ncbi:MAG TPA: metallophosphoesterase [Methylothermaceae bacterium]|nr:metallophosphoesterase [Methylothermaceae bacterium]